MPANMDKPRIHKNSRPKRKGKVVRPRVGPNPRGKDERFKK